MNKLEIGKWYRVPEMHRIVLALEVKDETITKYHSIIRNDYEGVLEGNLQGLESAMWDIKPLETLTPSEALILLAHGFVLKSVKHGFLRFINSDGWLFNEKNELIQMNNFNDLTIYALPEGKQNDTN